MLVVKVKLDETEFLLFDPESATRLREEIVAAVRAGGDFVSFTTVGHGVIIVLVSTGIPVRFEIIERSAEQVDAWEANPPDFDFDY